MRILLKYFFQVIKKSWLSFALILVSLCLVSATVYVNLSIDSDVLQIAENSLTSSYKGFNASLEFSDEEDGLSANTNFDKANRVLPFYVSYEKTRLENAGSIYVYQIDAQLEKVEQYQLITLSEGRMPSEEDEILITKEKASGMSLVIGDCLFLNERSLKITGFVENASIFTSEFPNVLETIGLLKNEQKCNYFLFDYSCSQEEFVASLPIEAGVDYSFNVFESSSLKKEKELKIIFGLILALVAIIGSFVIYSSSTMILNNQLPSIATFRSVGASKKRINVLLLFEGLLEGFFGSIIGIFAGEAGRFLIYRFYLNGEGYTPFSIPYFVLIAFGSTLLLQLLTTVLVLWHFHAKSMKDSMLSIEEGSSRFLTFLPYFGFLLIFASLILYFANTTKSLVLLILGAAFFFLGFVLAFSLVIKKIFKGVAYLYKHHSRGCAYLAAKSLASEKSNIRNALLTSLVLSLSFVSLFVTSSMNQFFASYRDRYNYSIMVSGQNGYTIKEKDCEYILKYADDVSHIVKEYWEYADSTMNGKELDRHVYYVKQNAELGGINYLGRDIEKESLAKGECLLDELFAKHYGFSLNDQISVHFTSEECEYSDFSVTVVGFCDSSIFNSNRDTMVLSDEDFLANITTGIHKIGLQLKEGTSLSAVLAKFKYLAFSVYDKKLKIQDASEYVQEEYDKVSQIITLLGFIPIFITFLSVMGLANNVLLLFDEKKKTYAVLSSTCMNKKKLAYLVFLEMLFMFITGVIFAFLFASFLIFLIRDILYVLFCYVEIEVSMSSILLLLGTTLLVLIVGFFIILRRLLKMDTIKEIRYE